MFFKTALTVFQVSKQSLLASSDLQHEWSNSVGKHLFKKFLEVFICHYGLGVSFSTGRDKHQPGSSILLIAKRKRVSRSSSSSQSPGPKLVNFVRH